MIIRNTELQQVANCNVVFSDKCIRLHVRNGYYEYNSDKQLSYVDIFEFISEMSEYIITKDKLLESFVVKRMAIDCNAKRYDEYFYDMVYHHMSKSTQSICGVVPYRFYLKDKYHLLALWCNTTGREYIGNMLMYTDGEKDYINESYSDNKDIKSAYCECMNIGQIPSISNIIAKLKNSYRKKRFNCTFVNRIIKYVEFHTEDRNVCVKPISELSMEDYARIINEVGDLIKSDNPLSVLFNILTKFEMLNDVCDNILQVSNTVRMVNLLCVSCEGESKSTTKPDEDSTDIRNKSTQNSSFDKIRNGMNELLGVGVSV